MAAALLAHHVSERACGDVEIRSAGTWADRGSPASSGARQVSWEHGIDVSAHASQPLERELIQWADLVIVMTSVHVQEVLELDPGAGSKTFMMKEFAELVYEENGGDPLRALLTAKRPAPRRSLDVDDPIGLPHMAYERCFKELESGVSALLDVLCPDNGGPGEVPP